MACTTLLAACSTPATHAAVSKSPSPLPVDPSVRIALADCARIMPLLDRMKSEEEKKPSTSADAAALRTRLYAIVGQIDRAMPSVLPQSPQTFSGALLELHDALVDIKAGKRGPDLYYLDDIVGSPCSQLQ